MEVDLAIRDEELMANLCHYIMVHMATSIELAHQGQHTKKQYGLKAGLKRFGSRSDAAVSKELSQFHTLQCFFPTEHPYTNTRRATQRLVFPHVPHQKTHR
jgi:hypothetical protein